MIDGIDAVNRPNIASVSSNRCIWSMLGVCSLRSGVQIRHIRHCDAVHSVRRQFRPPKPSSMSMIDGIDAVNRPNIASLSSNRCIWSMLGVGSLRRGVEIRLWSPSTVPAAHYKPSSMSIIEVLLDIAADCRPSLWLWCGVFACYQPLLSSLLLLSSMLCPIRVWIFHPLPIKSIILCVYLIYILNSMNLYLELRTSDVLIVGVSIFFPIFDCNLATGKYFSFSQTSRLIKGIFRWDGWSAIQRYEITVSMIQLLFAYLLFECNKYSVFSS